MLSRRTLFARLSAVALVPFARWLPKGEAKPQYFVAADVVGRGGRFTKMVYLACNDGMRAMKLSDSHGSEYVELTEEQWASLCGETNA